MTEDSARIEIDRPAYTESEFDRVAQYQRAPSSLRGTLAKLCACSFRDLMRTMVPVIKWIFTYKYQEYLLADVIAGLTVGLITVPQAMAYAMLAHAPPAIGLYMAVFPPVMYFFFSTSRHNSMGTFSVVSLMTGELVHELMEDERNACTSLQIIGTASFLVGLIQMGMYLLRLGLLANLLNDPLTNGFLSGAGVQVVASMIPSLFGLRHIKVASMFTIPNILMDIQNHLPLANRAVVTMSFVCILLAIIGVEIMKPWTFRKFGVVLPVELIIVIAATAVSYYMDLHNRFDIDVLGHVPAGFPKPTLPLFVIIPKIITKCVLIAIVSYSTTITMALMISTEARYTVRPNQELLAMSMANFAGCFFSCIPISSSLSRTWIQYTTGGKTQIATLVSATCIILVVLLINPLFNSLPKCVLASMVIVALKGMLQLARSVPQFFRLNYWDGLVWTAAFLPTVIFNDTVGLFCGLLMSAFTIFIRANQPYTCVLERVPGTEVYVDSGRFRGVESIDGVRIFHYCGALSYAMRLHFKHALYQAALMKPSAVLRSYLNPYGAAVEERPTRKQNSLRFLIIDFSAMRYIDPACVDLLHKLCHEFKEIDVATYIAGCNKLVSERLRICERAQHRRYNYLTFPTIHDAVTHAEHKIAQTKHQEVSRQPAISAV